MNDSIFIYVLAQAYAEISRLLWRSSRIKADEYIRLTR